MLLNLKILIHFFYFDRFVDIIHTNAGKIGSKYPAGDMDFWVNGGRKGHQGCDECVKKFGKFNIREKLEQLD